MTGQADESILKPSINGLVCHDAHFRIAGGPNQLLGQNYLLLNINILALMYFYF